MAWLLLSVAACVAPPARHAKRAPATSDRGTRRFIGTPDFGAAAPTSWGRNGDEGDGGTAGRETCRTE